MTDEERIIYREWKSKEDSASPTAALESIMILAVIDAKEERDILSGDYPNAFIQTDMPKVNDGGERVIMKITGVLVNMLVQFIPELYGPHVVLEKGKVLYIIVLNATGRKVLYVIVLKAINGMLDARSASKVPRRSQEDWIRV
jgi:hypothetical protein